MWILLAALGLGCGAPDVPTPGPGAEPYPPEVAAALSDALPDGARPPFTNRLLLEASPYLRQHAHDPVDWRPWGDEAFEEAARLGRPVLLSIGYATCHWCHVMADESFRDPEIAETLNTLYVPIKVDREERPDLDAIYMAAAQALGVRGGWPLTVWLTPERQPFYAGTYFPARDGDRGRPIGFLTVLRQARAALDADPARVAEDAARLAAHLRADLDRDLAGDFPGAATLDGVRARLTARYDPIWGGALGATKFPSGLPLRFLLREHLRTSDPAPLAMAEHTLTHMARGALRDPLGGGFHRYTIDRRWRVPHFEKMLYDNALLAMAYLEAWRVTGAAAHATIARETLDALLSEFQLPDGGFASAIDADGRDPRTGARVEGAYYTWTPEALREALGDDAPLAMAWFDVRATGDVDGRSALRTPLSVVEAAAALDEPEEALAARLDDLSTRLRAARATRPTPLRDDKVLTAWNGLAIGALARGALALDAPAYAEAAARAATFVLAHLRVDGRLHRRHAGGRAAHPAMLEDHAFLAAGLADLFEATGDTRWIEAAIALDAEIERHFADGAGGWFRTPADGEHLLARERPDHDGPEPTGSSVHALTLYRLGALTGDDAWRARGDRALRAHGDALARGVLTEMLIAVDWRLDRPKEIVIVTPRERAEAAPLLRVVARHGPRNRVIVVVPEHAVAGVGVRVAPVRDKVARDGKPTAYVCEQGLCLAPTTDPAALAALFSAP